MSALPSNFERARLRRALIQLASLLVLTLLASGLVSLFSLWSMERMQARMLERQSALLSAVDHARSAQVSFKIQVQSWKNLLLRGESRTNYETAMHEFEVSERRTDANLQSVIDWAETTKDNEARESAIALRAEHAKVGTGYRLNLPTSEQVPKLRDQADMAVRGIDRPLNSGLDELVTAMLVGERKTEGLDRATAIDRFATLSRIIWTSIGLSLLLVLSMLARTLRDPALKT